MVEQLNGCGSRSNGHEGCKSTPAPTAAPNQTPGEFSSPCLQDTTIKRPRSSRLCGTGLYHFNGGLLCLAGYLRWDSRGTKFHSSRARSDHLEAAK
jgi:hypothetical protein